MDDSIHIYVYLSFVFFHSKSFMTLSLDTLREVEDALNEFRDATVNRDIARADKIKIILTEFLEPEGYTLVEDPKLILIVKAKG